MIKELITIFDDSLNSFEGQRVGEKVLLLLRQHSFTILIKIGFFGLVALIPIALGLMFIPYFSAHGLLPIFFFLSTLWYMALWIGLFHALTIYTLNTVIITDQRIINSEQKGLFNRKISELNSNRIQDVSTHTNGIIETVLKFGNITVQSASSEIHFIFYQIPKPERVKEVIMKIATSLHSGIKATVPSDVDK